MYLYENFSIEVKFSDFFYSNLYDLHLDDERRENRIGRIGREVEG